MSNSLRFFKTMSECSNSFDESDNVGKEEEIAKQLRWEQQSR